MVAATDSFQEQEFSYEPGKILDSGIDTSVDNYINLMSNVPAMITSLREPNGNASVKSK